MHIEKGCWFGDGHGIEIGDYSGIGIDCYVPNDIVIGKYVMMGPRCYLFGRVTHEYSDPNIPMYVQGFKTLPKRTVIGDDVWIGRQVMILPGITIGSHSIIGAGSIVTKDVPPYSVVAGNPAEIKHKRK